MSETETAPWARLLPLDWDKHPSAEMWRVQTITGQYVVSEHDDKVLWTFDGWDRAKSRVAGDAESPEAGKDVAAEHFRQSLLSAFDLNAASADAGDEAGYASGQDLFARFSHSGPPRLDAAHIVEAPLRCPDPSKAEDHS